MTLATGVFLFSGLDNTAVVHIEFRDDCRSDVL